MPHAKKYPPEGGWPSEKKDTPKGDSLGIKLEVGVTRSGKEPADAHITIDLEAGSSTEVKEEHTEPQPPAATRKRKALAVMTLPDKHAATRSGKPADGAQIAIELGAESSRALKEEHTEPQPPAEKREAPVAPTPPDEHVWLPVGGPVPDREHAKNVANADLQSNGGWHSVVSGTGRSKLWKFISVDGRTGTKELSSISSIFMTHSPTHPFSRLHPSLPHSCIHESIHPWMRIHELTCGTDELICHRWGVQGSRRLLEEQR